MDFRLRLSSILFVALISTTFAAAHAESNAASDALPNAPTTQPAPESSSNSSSKSLEGKQTKRILYIIPNFRSVSANVKLPPMSAKEKFFGATQDSFDYSSFIFVGLLAGEAQATNSFPEFHQGAAGYARYYWHTFADQTDENYWVEAFLPIAFHQDPRYYTLGHGGVLKRTAYSFSRIFITRTDAGHEDFNVSEILGAGVAASISDLYYPSPERDWTKTGQRWLTNVSLDGATFVFKEFWPSINSAIFHQR